MDSVKEVLEINTAAKEEALEKSALAKTRVEFNTAAIYEILNTMTSATYINTGTYINNVKIHD